MGRRALGILLVALVVLAAGACGEKKKAEEPALSPPRTADPSIPPTSRRGRGLGGVKRSVLESVKLPVTATLRAPKAGDPCAIPNCVVYDLPRGTSLAALQEAINENARHSWKLISVSHDPTSQGLFLIWDTSGFFSG